MRSLIVLAALVVAGTAAAEPNLADLPPLNPAVKKGVLKNGLSYYVFPHQQPRQRAQLWLAVNAGSILEDDDQRGLAHMVEHMAFNGTKRFPKAAVVDFMEKAGMEFGADVNAYTSFDETVYQLTVPTDDKVVVGTGLDILRDWAGDIAFDPIEVEKERGVVLEEWRLGRGAFQRLYDKSVSSLFYRSRYADRLTIGLPEIIEHAPREAITRFYKDWYRPELMAVIAVGDFDGDDMEKQIVARFADLASSTKPRARVEAPIPRDHPLLVSVDSDPEMTATQVTLYEKLPAQPLVSVGDDRRDLVQAVFDAMLNERLAELSQRTTSPFLSAASGADHLGRTADVVARQAQAKAGHAAEALAGLYTEVARVKKFGFSQTELERAKRAELRRIDRAALEADKTDSREFADEITRNYFINEQMPGRAMEAKLTRELLPGITLAEVNQLAKKRKAGGRAIIVNGPASAPLPSREDVLKMAAAADRADLQPWVEAPVVTTLINELPPPGKVTSQRKVANVGVVEWTLSNGAKVVVKPTDFQNDDVRIEGFASGGSSLVSDADFNNTRFAAQIENDSGVGDFDRSSLERALNGKVAHVSTNIDELQETVSAGGSAEDLETILQLVHLRFTAPRRDDEAFKAWRARTRDWTEHKDLMPEVSFFEQMSAVASSEHPRRVPVTVKDVDAVDPDRALALYRERFADASGFTFVIVGNVDEKTLKPLVEQYLATLPSLGRKEKYKDIGARFPKGDKELTVTQGQEPKSFVYFARNEDQKWSRVADDDLEMLQRLLEIRLREVLREDMSGVYSVSVWASEERQPHEERNVGFFFGCDPKNVAALKDAAVATLKSVQTDGLGDIYVEKVKEQITRTHETNLRDNEWWTNQLAYVWRHGDDTNDIIDINPLLNRVTHDNIRAAAKKYLDGPDSLLAVLRPAPSP